ncbi:Putative EF-hand domain, nucleobindin [Septoria linicola]|uniref:EF-hand domain, nucleobindin n=1 Tax=Septoria linicola TaxID=215465 RepID=A0A9Q9EPV1_9PEZI|nr:putative EF-hand domain, nucleobindin [Septoria linicola]USW56898.1 Putative EF-hand domain, nucleobindin [Septoria linicola]
MFRLAVVVATATLLSNVQAHGDHAHEAAPHVDANADWATRHMAEEHHISIFDAGSFFDLHDYDSSNFWTADDLLKTYGLRDESTNHISEDEKRHAIQRVIDMYDRDKDNRISFAEYTIGAQGLVLPDLGYGPGHHGDDEYEYEIHHFEKYHDENTREEDLTHPEDIEHFRKHEEMEARQERQEQMDRMPIIEANIPMKFRKKEL